MNPALEIDDVSFGYGDRQAVQRLSLTLAAGESMTVLGPNGSGKSTLFRMVTTLCRPDSGSVRVCGHDTLDEPAAARRQLGVVFQSGSLDTKLTVFENLRHHAHLHNLGGQKARRRIAEMLERFHLSDRESDPVQHLSGGLRRRVELARSMLHQPRVLVLDEPTAGLDPGARLAFWEMLDHLRSEHQCSVMCTSHLIEEAERSNHTAILDAGALVVSGSPQELRAEMPAAVITITCPQPDLLAPRIKEKFDVDPVKIGTHLRLESVAAGQLTADLLSTFPEEIDTISTGKATLEDVYIRHTGKSFDINMK